MQEKILFGTYTKKTSEGIYEAILDTQKRELIDATLVAKVGNPTYLATSKAGKIYSVDKHGDQGGIFVLDNTTRPTTKLSEHMLEAAPAYVAVDEARQLIYAGYYHIGLTEVLKINGDSLELVDSIKNEGHGPRPEQASAHVHFTGLTPDQRLVVVDLGSDRVDTYDVVDSGKLTHAATLITEAGFGPRHIRFNPDGTHAYLLGELSSKLSVLTYNQADGSFKVEQTVSTLPSDWTEFNGAAAIRVSKDGKFIYTSNRGHNSIAVFAITENGNHVELIQTISTEGEFPRDFDLNSTEEFVVVANQDTDNVSLLSRDATTGKLSLVQKDFSLPEGVRVHFE
ncbi:lactonase family protein [Periweissella fabalis]|uniref:Lactonase family protein n=1 Tax=Periweissella fabalis TaxID=1070421 RepID=A0A7X6N3Q7_9LACO|nr:lactonase family protein [Periweissella fabalis]MCM0598848.1 lactonase family protein [Periweissella fabalis]NKZ24510.1 lactonase family protein [Periweissella fabalis]